MDYEQYKTAAIEGQLAEQKQRTRAEKTSSLSLICAMLIAGTIGFYSTRIDLEQLSASVQNAHQQVIQNDTLESR